MSALVGVGVCVGVGVRACVSEREHEGVDNKKEIGEKEKEKRHVWKGMV